MTAAPPTGDFRALVHSAAEEIRAAAAATDPGAVAAMVAEIAATKRIALHGVGREGLMMRALAMRLYHMGLDAHVVGDMSCPPVGPGDLLLVSAGPGHFSTIAALVATAKAAGARAGCFTAQPGGTVPRACDVVLTIPAQTMADDQRRHAAATSPSTLPMGSLYEGAQYLVFEILILLLRDRLGVSPEAMRARHTNLE